MESPQNVLAKKGSSTIKTLVESLGTQGVKPKSEYDRGPKSTNAEPASAGYETDEAKGTDFGLGDKKIKASKSSVREKSSKSNIGSHLQVSSQQKVFM